MWTTELGNILDTPVDDLIEFYFRRNLEKSGQDRDGTIGKLRNFSRDLESVGGLFWILDYTFRFDDHVLYHLGSRAPEFGQDSRVLRAIDGLLPSVDSKIPECFPTGSQTSRSKENIVSSMSCTSAKINVTSQTVVLYRNLSGLLQANRVPSAQLPFP